MFVGSGGDGGRARGRASHLVGGWRCGEGLGRGDGRRDGARGRVAHGLAERDGQLLTLGQHLGRRHHDGWGVAEPTASRGVVRFVSRVDSRASLGTGETSRVAGREHRVARCAASPEERARVCAPRRTLAPRRGRSEEANPHLPHRGLKITLVSDPIERNRPSFDEFHKMSQKLLGEETHAKPEAAARRNLVRC